jgi:ribosomal protein S18 acetylase RimI-like enzyme
VTTPALYLRHAADTDLDLVLAWRAKTAAWIADVHGSDQWQVPYPRSVLAERLADTYMAMLAPDAEPVATITVSEWADPALWTPDELATSARYLYKVNVVREHAGTGIGRTLIQWGIDRAARKGADVVRCDVWSTNQTLQEYYKSLGFRYLRTVPGFNSGALYECPAATVENLPIIEISLR